MLGGNRPPALFRRRRLRGASTIILFRYLFPVLRDIVLLKNATWQK
jgi:hypothetical protein